MRVSVNKPERPRADNARSYWRVQKLPKFKFLKAVLDRGNFGRGKRLSANLGKSWWIHFFKWNHALNTNILFTSLARSFRPSNWLFIIDKYSSVWYDDSEYFLKTLKISRWFIRHTFFIVPCCYCSIVTWFFGHLTTENEAIEFYSDDAIKIKFVKLWDLSQYSERTSSKWPTCQKLAFRGKLSRSLRY